MAAARTKGEVRALTISVLAVVAWCAFIFFMSANNSDESSSMSNGICLMLGHVFFPSLSDEQAIDLMSFAVRKTAHFSEYAVLGALVLNLLYRLFKHKPALPVSACAWLLCTLYAAGDEFHQSFVPGRSPQVGDVCIDSCGVLLGVVVLALVLRYRCGWGKAE